MKKLFILIFAGATLGACNNNSEVKPVIDSIEQRKDTLLENIDSTKKAIIDSVEDWGKRQAEKVDSATKARKDSVKN
jgi:hypothetical protein